MAVLAGFRWLQRDAAEGGDGADAPDEPQQQQQQRRIIVRGFGVVPAVGRKRALPADVRRRGGGHMRIARDSKELKHEQREHQDDSTDYIKLCSAWDQEFGLRQGDRIHTPGQYREPNFQGNTWSHDGLLKAGWQEVGGHGRHSVDTAGVGETSQGLPALVMLASATHDLMQQSVKDFLDTVADNGSLHISRNFDPTPLVLGFGRFQSELQPHARYVVPDDEKDGRFKSVEWDEYHKL